MQKHKNTIYGTKMEKNSTEELLRLIKQNNSKSQIAFAELTERYSVLLKGAVGRLCGNIDTGEYEDMLQEANIALFNAAISYDMAQSKVSFGLYAKICINNYIVSRMRKSGQLKKRDLYSLEELRELGIYAEPSSDGQSDPSELLIDKENFSSLKSLIKENLSVYENSVFSLYMSGRSTKDIADSLGKSDKSIDNAICRIRIKLKKLLL